MITRAEVVAASAALDETAISMLVTVIRMGAKYRATPHFYTDLRTRIEEAETVEARQLNVILNKIEALGIGEVELVGGDEGIRYSKTREREALINYALGVLYTEPFESVSVNLSDVRNVDFKYGIGQRLTDLD